MDNKRVSVRDVTESSEDGPIVRLINEIKVSNALSVFAVRLHYVALVVLILQAAAVGVAAYSIMNTSAHLIELDSKSANLIAELEQLSKKMTAQAVATAEVKTQLDEAPRIVADSETGQLKVVATVDRPKAEKEPELFDSVPKEAIANAKLKKSAQRVLSKVDDALEMLQEPAAASAEDPVTIEILLDTASAEQVAR